MSKEIDLNKRKTVLHRIPFIIGSLALAPSILIPEMAEARDLKYKEYSLPDKASLDKLLSSMNYPSEFELYYEIPGNGDKNGDSVKGNFRMSRTLEKTTLRAEIMHPRESKILEISQQKDFGSNNVLYTESDFDPVKGVFRYKNETSLWQGDEKNTPINLVNDLFDGKIQYTSYLFRGSGVCLNEHTLEVRTKQEDGFSLVHEAKIKDGSPRITKIKVSYVSVRGTQIPVEIRVDYKVKAFNIPLLGPVYVTPTLIGVLKA